MYGLYEGAKPSLMICDPELIRKVLVKDFDHFCDRRSFPTKGEDEWLNEMLTTICGDQWKKLRSTVSPTFSSGKLKYMFELVHNHAKSFVTHCAQFRESGECFDMKDSYGRFTMDVIASCAFGIECNSLTQEKSIFAEKANDVFSMSFFKILKFMGILLLPQKFIDLTGISFIDDSWRFFKSVSKETASIRKDQEKSRGDFLDLLLAEQKKQEEEFDESRDYRITENTILAESVLFLVAGYDTTANVLSFTSYHLAKNEQIQERLREELKEIIEEHGELNYHNIMEAKYLDACINENLRRVAPGPVLERKCTKEYHIPNSNITIPEGMYVQIPVLGIHLDPEFWEQPEEFNPERFMPENKNEIKPFTYMPFGLGPRNCIAMRFALMEAKICLAEFVLNYKFTLAPGNDEIKFEFTTGLIRPTKGLVSVYLQDATEN